MYEWMEAQSKARCTFASVLHSNNYFPHQCWCFGTLSSGAPLFCRPIQSSSRSINLQLKYRYPQMYFNSTVNVILYSKSKFSTISKINAIFTEDQSMAPSFWFSAGYLGPEQTQDTLDGLHPLAWLSWVGNDLLKSISGSCSGVREVRCSVCFISQLW